MVWFTSIISRNAAPLEEDDSSNCSVVSIPKMDMVNAKDEVQNKQTTTRKASTELVTNTFTTMIGMMLLFPLLLPGNVLAWLQGGSPHQRVRSKHEQIRGDEKNASKRHPSQSRTPSSPQGDNDTEASHSSPDCDITITIQHSDDNEHLDATKIVSVDDGNSKDIRVTSVSKDSNWWNRSLRETSRSGRVSRTIPIKLVEQVELQNSKGLSFDSWQVSGEQYHQRYESNISPSDEENTNLPTQLSKNDSSLSQCKQSRCNKNSSEYKYIIAFVASVALLLGLAICLGLHFTGKNVYDSSSSNSMLNERPMSQINGTNTSITNVTVDVDDKLDNEHDIKANDTTRAWDSSNPTNTNSTSESEMRDPIDSHVIEQNDSSNDMVEGENTNNRTSPVVTKQTKGNSTNNSNKTMDTIDGTSDGNINKTVKRTISYDEASNSGSSKRNGTQTWNGTQSKGTGSLVKNVFMELPVCVDDYDASYLKDSFYDCKWLRRQSTTIIVELCQHYGNTKVVPYSHPLLSDYKITIDLVDSNVTSTNSTSNNTQSEVDDEARDFDPHALSTLLFDQSCKRTCNTVGGRLYDDCGQ